MPCALCVLLIWTLSAGKWFWLLKHRPVQCDWISWAGLAGSMRDNANSIITTIQQGCMWTRSGPSRPIFISIFGFRFVPFRFDVHFDIRFDIQNHVPFRYSDYLGSVPFRYDVHFEIQINIRSVPFRYSDPFRFDIQIRSVSIFRCVPFRFDIQIRSVSIFRFVPFRYSDSRSVSIFRSVPFRYSDPFRFNIYMSSTLASTLFRFDIQMRSVPFRYSDPFRFDIQMRSVPFWYSDLRFDQNHFPADKVQMRGTHNAHGMCC